MKKLLCIFISILLCTALFSSCKKEEPAPDEEPTTTVEETTHQTVPEHQITLGYYEKKSFNPYTTESPLNRSLVTLVYDGLYLPDDGYSVSPLIASSATNEGNKLTVQIADEIYFSDGSPISASDVVYSYNLAKSNSFYSKRLMNIMSATASSGSVIFTLARGDIYAESCLTFPIVKSGTGADSIPVGSGRYTIRKSDGQYTLEANESTSRKEEMSVGTIRLVPVSSEKGELYLLQTGDLSYFFDDLSDGEYTKIGANIFRTSLNNLVFLSLNRSKEIFADKNVVKAISQCLDITALCDSAFEGMYRLPKTVFNPDWYVVKDIEAEKSQADAQSANDLLEKSGYVYAYSHNAFRSKNFEFIEMTLLVSSESEQKVTLAKEIKKSLEEIGIRVNLESKEYDDYISDLKDGNFDLYIGEIRLSANMDLSPFFSESGAAHYGIDPDSTTAAAYFDFARGAVDASTFLQVFSSEMPFIPLCYRDGMAYYSREITFEGTVNEYEPFKNIYSWDV